jgi:phage shock protein A
MRGLFGGWIRDRENRSPQAVYEQAIEERVRQYAQLKQAVAGILYMRNKLEAEMRERRHDLSRARDLIKRAVERGDDQLALRLIEQKDSLINDLERGQHELAEVGSEVETAKGNLVKFRGEIRSLEHEKVRILAQLANAHARKRIQDAIDGLSVESDMKALENVREHVARLRAEGTIDRELGDEGLQTRVRAIREEARNEAARLELAEIKRRLRPEVLPMPPQEQVVNVASQ